MSAIETEKNHPNIVSKEEERILKLKHVKETFFRYFRIKPEDCGKYILLTNFPSYVKYFSEKYNKPISGEMMQICTHENISIINFNMGNPNAALIMDCMLAVEPEAVLFLGKCGGTKSSKIGQFFMPVSAINMTGVRAQYDIMAEISCCPFFEITKVIDQELTAISEKYLTGSVFTTDRRIWEHCEQFKNKIKKSRAIGVDMETAVLFDIGYYNKIPNAALLLVSDLPLDKPKDEETDKMVTASFMKKHIETGINVLKNIIRNGITIHRIY